eukprot:6212713-Pleurochrysis_carterae.AAC.1
MAATHALQCHRSRQVKANQLRRAPPRKDDQRLPLAGQRLLTLALLPLFLPSPLACPACLTCATQPPPQLLRRGRGLCRPSEHARCKQKKERNWKEERREQMGGRLKTEGNRGGLRA